MLTMYLIRLNSFKVINLFVIYFTVLFAYLSLNWWFDIIFYKIVVLKLIIVNHTIFYQFQTVLLLNLFYLQLNRNIKVLYYLIQLITIENIIYQIFRCLIWFLTYLNVELNDLYQISNPKLQFKLKYYYK